MDWGREHLVEVITRAQCMSKVQGLGSLQRSKNTNHAGEMESNVTHDLKWKSTTWETKSQMMEVEKRPGETKTAKSETDLDTSQG